MRRVLKNIDSVVGRKARCQRPSMAWSQFRTRSHGNWTKPHTRAIGSVAWWPMATTDLPASNSSSACLGQRRAIDAQRFASSM